MDVNNKATINTHPAIAITVPMLPLPNCGKKVAAGRLHYLLMLCRT
jgi:hypothetical protein|nr:MAG TPA: hypothetical protein [Caudoviricetes sp.]